VRLKAVFGGKFKVFDPMVTAKTSLSRLTICAWLPTIALLKSIDLRPSRRRLLLVPRSGQSNVSTYNVNRISETVSSIWRKQYDYSRLETLCNKIICRSFAAQQRHNFKIVTVILFVEKKENIKTKTKNVL